MTMDAILIVDDEPYIVDFLKVKMEQCGYRVLTASSGEGAMELIETENPAVVLSDIALPDINGIELLKRLHECRKDLYVILMTGYQDMETTVRAMQAGAFDYISKPINMDELEGMIRRAIEAHRLNDVIADLSPEIFKNYAADTIIGKSKAMLEVFKLIGMASRTNATVMIQGETGTGKELVARAIHHYSNAKDRPFVPVNCSAMVETLLESELFGHEKGAFTGATYRKRGRFELASEGTIFIDEVGDIPLSIQTKLLRIIQERVFERVGGESPIKVKVRIIAATNQDLAKLIQQNLFREDLYYRLKVITINLPPLRERKEDIPILAEYLLDRINRELHKNVKKVDPNVMDIFMNYNWKGNVREMENVITRAILLSRGNVLLKEHIPGDIYVTASDGKTDTYEIRPLKDVEKDAIYRALAALNWHKGKVCNILGLPRPRLERKIKKYQLKPHGSTGLS